MKKGRCNVETVPRQWMSLKMMVKIQFQDMSYSRLWSTMLTKAKNPTRLTIKMSCISWRISLCYPSQVLSVNMHFPPKTASKVQNVPVWRGRQQRIWSANVQRVFLWLTLIMQSQAADLWFSNGENPWRLFFKCL